MRSEVVGRSVGRRSVCRLVCRLICLSVRKFSLGLSVGQSLCPQVFSRIVAVVDTKRGYVGMCNGRSAQQESFLNRWRRFC